MTRIGTLELGLGLALAVAGWIAFGLVGTASADVRRVEAVGIYGIEESARLRVIPKDEAIEHATWEGVSRVALELIGERGPTDLAEPSLGGLDGMDGEGDPLDRPTEVAPPDDILAPIDGPAGATNGLPLGDDPRLDVEGGPDEGQIAALEEALGKDMLPYTRSYRILEDRGEVPVLFDEDPEIETEYVVVVEVFVDVDRVAAALERTGLIMTAAAADPEALLTLEVLGLARYEGLAHLVGYLRDSLGATRVRTLEFSRERQVLALEGRFGLEELATRLAESADAALVLEPLAVDPTRSRIRVRARYAPPPPDLELPAPEARLGRRSPRG